MKDILHEVVLSPRAVEAWRQTTSAAASLPISPDEVMDEAAEELSGGKLRISVIRADGSRLIYLDVPTDEWAWRA